MVDAIERTAGVRDPTLRCESALCGGPYLFSSRRDLEQHKLEAHTQPCPTCGHHPADSAGSYDHWFGGPMDLEADWEHAYGVKLSPGAEQRMLSLLGEEKP